ncbi:hypothetical protein BCR44DRAFT_1427453 [Catenaria anguillulae PL171]|uniref:Uncharacterized protein n=1 Tax=Catenaria anguillulae PL171 TaxID=765915 RepID=A0A1Y2HX94_9FUNG|nr:hypothetical protein BCR44DRAFT_1427453 [Catenaria anguillulae PL171]
MAPPLVCTSPCKHDLSIAHESPMNLSYIRSGSQVPTSTMPPLPPPPSSPWTSSLPALYAAECDDYPSSTSRHRSRHLPAPPRRASPTIPDRHPWIMFNDDPFEYEIASIMSKLPVVPPAHPARESAQRRAALILHHLRPPQRPLDELPSVHQAQYTTVDVVAAPSYLAGKVQGGFRAARWMPTQSPTAAAAASSSHDRPASRRVWRM